MEKSEKELIEIILKNLINMHEKINIITEVMVKEVSEEEYKRQFYKEEDTLVEIETDTYKQMCKLIGEGTIPFMGIA
tara:strand:+ start:917 stop:1147 length:231 start_codon:yes stop_codon:yes gene_type:complete